MLITSCNGNDSKDKCEVAVLDFPPVVAACITEDEKKGVRDGTLRPDSAWARLVARCPDVAKVDEFGACLWNLRTYPAGLLITNKDDMMTQLKKFVDSAKCCVSKLTIVGHGGPGIVTTGGGQTVQSCQHINGSPESMAEWKEKLKGLKDILCPGATIAIDACNTAEGETGLAKLQEIAKEYGVTVTGFTTSCYSGKTFDQEPDASKRTVTPPVGEVVKPGAGEKDSLLKKQADKVKEKMKQNTGGTFKKNVQSIGFYLSTNPSIPMVSQQPALPIANQEWILGFIESIDASRVYEPETPEPYVSDMVIVVKYEDGSYGYVHTILGNRLIGIAGNDAKQRLFSISDRGMQLLREGLELTGGK